MENLEISAKTLEEATKKALTRLNVGLDEVEITILNEGKSGILGIGAAEARISVRLKKPEMPDQEGVAEAARDILKNVLGKMGIKAEYNIVNPFPLFDDSEATSSIAINISGDDLGMLIGRRGQTLDALQSIIRLITAKQTNSKAQIVIDVENYKQRRYEDLKTLALNVAQQVKASKSSFKLEPMSPFERRIVHVTLANDPDVMTESVGEGEGRKVVIIPKNN
jgi:spoIIIJ-associated protein